LTGPAYQLAAYQSSKALMPSERSEVATVEGEMGVAGFLVNMISGCGVSLWLEWP
jgi:hypothetical protein